MVETLTCEAHVWSVLVVGVYPAMRPICALTGLMTARSWAHCLKVWMKRSAFAIGPWAVGASVVIAQRQLSAGPREAFASIYRSDSFAAPAAVSQSFT